MACTWTASRLYSDYITIQARGDGGVLKQMYIPTKDGTRLIGEGIYVNSWDPAEHTVTTPDCTGYLAGQTCNAQQVLTKYLNVDKQCYDDCRWAQIATDESMQELGQSMVIAHLNTLMPLIYADMIANGTATLAGAAAPSEAQARTAMTTVLMAIAAYGGTPGAIILDMTLGGTIVAGMGALFTPILSPDINFSYGPGLPIGRIGGFPVFVSPDNLATADATPVQVCAIIFARKGFAYAHEGEGLGIKITWHPENVNGTNDVIGRACLGYKTLNANLVRYITAA